MHPLIRLGLELPPLGFGADRRQTDSDVIALLEVARLAEDAAIGTLWITEAPPDGFDPVPLAGFLAGRTSRLGLGIVVRPGHGRHPSVVVRDVTTIDLLTGGRAAVAVLEDGRGPLDVERVAEATAILHALLTDEEVTVAGRFYEVAELTTRPRPVRPEGPPVIAGFAGQPLPSDDRSAESVVLEASGAAYVTGGDASDVAECRARLDGAAPAGSDPVLVWRGRLPNDASGEFATSILEAGADGMIAVLDDGETGGMVEQAGLKRVLDALGSIADDLRA